MEKPSEKPAFELKHDPKRHANGSLNEVGSIRNGVSQSVVSVPDKLKRDLCSISKHVEVALIDEHVVGDGLADAVYSPVFDLDSDPDRPSYTSTVRFVRRKLSRPESLPPGRRNALLSDIIAEVFQERNPID